MEPHYLNGRGGDPDDESDRLTPAQQDELTANMALLYALFPELLDKVDLSRLQPEQYPEHRALAEMKKRREAMKKVLRPNGS